MSDPTPFSAADLTNPDLAPDALRQMANSDRTLWPAIVQHPNCYPQLADWINAQLAAQPQVTVQPESQAQPQVTPQPEQPQVTPQPEQPTYHQQSQEAQALAQQAAQQAMQTGQTATFQQPASQQGMPMQPVREPNETLQQMSEGAKQMATGAKTFITETVAPQIVEAAKSADKSKLAAFAPFATILVYYHVILAHFLPVITASSMGMYVAISHFSPFLLYEGYFFLLFWLITLIVGVIGLAQKNTTMVTISNTFGIISGALSLLTNLGIVLFARSLMNSVSNDALPSGLRSLSHLLPSGMGQQFVEDMDIGSTTGPMWIVFLSLLAITMSIVTLVVNKKAKPIAPVSGGIQPGQPFQANTLQQPSQFGQPNALQQPSQFGQSFATMESNQPFQNEEQQ